MRSMQIYITTDIKILLYCQHIVYVFNSIASNLHEDTLTNALYGLIDTTQKISLTQRLINVKKGVFFISK